MKVKLFPKISGHFASQRLTPGCHQPAQRVQRLVRQRGEVGAPQHLHLLRRVNAQLGEDLLQRRYARFRAFGSPKPLETQPLVGVK